MIRHIRDGRPLAWIAAGLLSLTMGMTSVAAASDVPTLRSWDEHLSVVRNGGDAPALVYFGGTYTKVSRGLRDGVIDTKGLPVVMIEPGSMVQNPVTGRPILGYDLQQFFGGNAGSIVFLGDLGIPLQQLSLPSLFHGSSAPLIEGYAQYVQSATAKTISLADYMRATGREQHVMEAIARLRGNESAFRVLAPGTALVGGVNYVSKEVFDPWKNPGVFIVYTTNPESAIAIAQINEMCIGLAEWEPRIALVVPEGTVPDLGRYIGFQGLLIHAPKDRIASMGAGPITQFVANRNGSQRGLRMDGFAPADLIAAVMALPNGGAAAAVYPAIPQGETDDAYTMLASTVDAVLKDRRGATP